MELTILRAMRLSRAISAGPVGSRADRHEDSESPLGL